MNLKVLRQRIVKILRDYGESFPADKGVDPEVCKEAADEILKQLRRQTIRVIVAVRGGVIQGALADLPNIQLEVRDFDAFATEKNDALGRDSKEEAETSWEDSQSKMHAIL